MRALTICQPYAELIMRGAKRVENRGWPTTYRGALLVHAGKSKEWLELDIRGNQDETYQIPLAEMDFGKIVGVVQVRGCIRHPGSRGFNRAWDATVLNAWPWLATHEHASGPYCWILEDAFRFSTPVPFRGRQGIFDVPAGLVAVGLSEAMEARSAKCKMQIAK